MFDSIARPGSSCQCFPELLRIRRPVHSTCTAFQNETVDGEQNSAVPSSPNVWNHTVLLLKYRGPASSRSCRQMRMRAGIGPMTPTLNNRVLTSLKSVAKTYSKNWRRSSAGRLRRDDVGSDIDAERWVQLVRNDGRWSYTCMRFSDESATMRIDIDLYDRIDLFKMRR